MEQKTFEDNSAFRFGTVVLATWTISTVLILSGAWVVSKVTSNKSEPTYTNLITESYYKVMTANVNPDHTGQAVINLDNFKVPVKFSFENTVQHSGPITEPLINIKSLEIGPITDMSGKHHYRDFTNYQDHKGINAALVAHIKKKSTFGGCLNDY